MHRRLSHTAVLAFVLSVGASGSAHAHAFAQRYDLPLPLWLYLVGAGAVVALSFVLVSLFGAGHGDGRSIPRMNLLKTAVGRSLARPGVVFLLRLSSVTTFFLMLAAGFFGTQDDPLDNILPVTVWVVWWVGLAYVSALVGDLWALLNPLRIVAEWVRALVRLAWPQFVFSRRAAPPWIGAWPAVALFFAFAWAELVWPNRSMPQNLAFAITNYSVITWLGMYHFGIDEWIRRGEAFSMVFGLFARFAPTELRVETAGTCPTCSSQSCRDNHGPDCVGCHECFRHAPDAERQLNLRPYAVGLAATAGSGMSVMAFVLLVLSTVSFDGFADTPLWQRSFSAALSVPAIQALPNALGLSNAHGLIMTAGLVAAPLLFFAVFVLVCQLMVLFVPTEGSGQRRSSNAGRPSALDVARIFVFTLVPIAIAYHLAHFLSFFLIFGQFIIPLVSDPFGFGWDLFGTAGYRADIAIVSARFVWFSSVAAIVLGHVAAVYLGHVMALRTFADRRMAIRSQYPMLVLMVGYTMVSLWILAQPIVEA